MSGVNKISGSDNVRNYDNAPGKISQDNNSEFSSYLGETKKLDEIFDKAAKKYNVPVELLKAIGKAESDFDTQAVSRCGAQGVMQLMPATAKGLGVTNAFDPEQNIMGGAKYISGLIKKYSGDTSLALAAYNAGSGNVAKYDGIPPFKETQNYVKKILKYLEQGGIEIRPAQNGLTRGNTYSGASGLVQAATVPTPVLSNLSYVLTGDLEGKGDSMEDLSEVFSYDEYLKFLDIFLDGEKEEENDDKSNNQTTKDINYNVPVLNLLMDQKQI